MNSKIFRGLIIVVAVAAGISLTIMSMKKGIENFQNLGGYVVEKISDDNEADKQNSELKQQLEEQGKQIEELNKQLEDVKSRRRL